MELENEQEPLFFEENENEIGERPMDYPHHGSIDYNIDLADIYLSNEKKYHNDHGEKIHSLNLSDEELDRLYHSIIFQKDKIVELEKIVFTAPQNILSIETTTKEVYYYHLLAKAFLMSLYANDVHNKLNRAKAKLFAKEIIPLIRTHVEEIDLPETPKNTKKRKIQELLKYFYYFLGIFYSMNLGGDNQPAKGIEYFEKAIELEYYTALCNLGICYIKGNGVTKDEKKGFECFHRSAARGYAGGQHNLALCYEKGIGAQKNPYEALKYERMSAEQGFLNAIYHLATYYENGFGLADEIQTTPDDPTALESMISESDRKKANMEEAIRLYQMAAELGHEQAQFIIASYYEKGKSSLLAANPAEAFRWYLICGEKGNPLAQYKLSYFYEHGIGCQINENEAFRWCVKSAELNDFVSQNILGTYYEKGIGCEINYQEAVFWYRKSAEQGYSNAQYNLGRCLLKGIGVPYKDAAEGLKWHRLCANQGEYMAEKSLYHCYKHGIGCDPDEVEAKKWYKRVKLQKERLESSGKQLSLRDTYVSRRQSLDEAILQQHQTLLLGGHNNQEEANNEPIPPPPAATPLTPSPNNRRRTSSADLITNNSKASSSSLLTTTAQGKVFRRKNINDNKEYAIKFIPTLLFTYKTRSGAMMPITSLKKQKRRRSTSSGNVSNKETNASNKETGKYTEPPIPQQSHYLKDENFYTSSFHELQAELDVLTQLNHNHVVRCHQNYFQKVHAERYYCVVFELIDYQGNSGNTLKRKMKMMNSIHYNTKCLWLKQCLDALTYLHERHIYHYNLSPDCIYFVTDNFLKLTDITLKSMLFVPSSPDPMTEAEMSDLPTPGGDNYQQLQQQQQKEKKTFQLPLTPALLMKKIVHYQKSHCYLSFEKICLFMSPDKKHAQNQINPKAALLSPVPPSTENNSSSQMTSGSGRNRSYSKDVSRETGGYSLPPTIVIPPENAVPATASNPSPAIPIEREFYRPSPSGQSPFLPNVKSLKAYAESDLLDGARDDFWTLGCIFAEVLLGQRLKDIVATSFELFHINEEHAQRKEALLVKCFEKEKEVRISYESAPAVANQSVPSTPLAINTNLDGPESAKKSSPPKSPPLGGYGGGEMISYGLINHFIENAWKYSTERMTVRNYFLHYFLPHFQENPYLMELAEVDLPTEADDDHHHRTKRPSLQPVAPQNSLNVNTSGLPNLQSQSASPRARASSRILGVSTSQGNLAASTSQSSVLQDHEGYFVINEDQEIVPVRQGGGVHGGDGGSRGRRPSYYEDEKHHITSDMMSEIYEYIRLNKMKLKKLEKLAYKKSSMIAKGFLMTLFLCDPIYYQFDKAIELSQELIPWLREKEQQMSQLMLTDGVGGEDHEGGGLDENVEYVMFFLGIYYAFKLYQYEPAYLEKVNQERFAVDTRENHLQGSSSVRRIRSISGESFGAKGNRRSISGESKEERRLRFSSDESRVPFSPTTLLQMNDITLEEEQQAKAKSSNRSSPGMALGTGSGSRRATPNQLAPTQDNEQAAVPFFMQSIEQGYLIAQNNIGVCYALGIGVPRDYEEAVKWFHMSAHDGNELGQYNLATCFEKGFGVRIDKQEAFRLFILSADQGCSLARCKLGECYEFGIGVTRSYSEAIRWYKLSADQGNAKGQFHLGQFYEKGKGCNTDLDMAVKWYRLAAEQGYNVAQYTLALCYENGTGVEKNQMEAQRWYEQNLVEKPYYPAHQIFVM